MPLTKEERIDIILLAVAKLNMKFKRAVSVADASISGRPKMATYEDMSTQLLAALARRPFEGLDLSLRRMGIS